MAIFKCKMCGGTIDFEPGATVGVCEYCGTKQTLPRIDDERKAHLYERANHFRRANDYDRAMAIYEQILDEDISDAEAYWSLVLCRYGIEYVEDPVTHKWVPTVNRVQYTSIFADEDYKAALSHADTYQQVIYEQEAKAIDEIQKGILAISEKEEPFDIFICYKETDNNGRRTEDSVLAYDIYKELTKEGYKVFFARVTLEDKLGTAYEPYIFAALNSAKIMIAVGTKAEYYNAVWVKNEWSRYLALIKKGQQKTLIPAYKGMDPYDLPEEFSHLQGQDMGKLGYMQDMVRGIQKILGESEKRKETSAEVGPLLEKAKECLEKKDWENAKEYFVQTLDLDPRNTEANLGILLCALKVSKKEDLANLNLPFDNSDNFKQATRYADEQLKNELAKYNEDIRKRNANKAKKGIKIIIASIALVLIVIAGYFLTTKVISPAVQYAKAGRLHEEANKLHIEEKYGEAIAIYESLGAYKDSPDQMTNCKRDNDYTLAYNEGMQFYNAENYSDALTCFEKAGDIYQDTVDKKKECVIKIKESAYELVHNGEIMKALKELIIHDSFPEIIECIVDIEKTMILKAKVGDTIYMGHIEQNGEERTPIEWVVLEKNGSELLLQSKYILGTSNYSDGLLTTWKDSNLRSYLQKQQDVWFFDRELKKLLVLKETFHIEGNDNSANETNCEDYLILLNAEQLKKYYTSAEERKAYRSFEDMSKSLLGEDYWLLSGPEKARSSDAVTSTGAILLSSSVSDVTKGVRPACWVNAED